MSSKNGIRSLLKRSSRLFPSKAQPPPGESSSRSPVVSPLYRPLNEHALEIRLLEILPTENVKLECRLRTVSLAINPTYAALSYVWGDSEITEEIIVNGIEIGVRPNLAALRNVESNWDFDEPFRLWTDAICINQDDNVERGKQVELMKSIYAQASVVFAWFGNSDEQTELGLQTFHLLYTELRAMGEQGNVSDMLHLEWIRKHGCLNGDDTDDMISNKAWKSVWALVQSSYWSRVWIFQEVCLAKKLLLVHGKVSLDYASFTVVCVLLNLFKSLFAEHNIAKPDFVSPGVWRIVYQKDLNCDHIIHQGLVRESVQLGRTLSAAQQWLFADFTSTLKATDHKDHIYGLLGVTSLKITPNYDKPINEIYTEYISAWLHDRSQLDPGNSLIFNMELLSKFKNELFFLPYAGIGRFDNPYNLPSWAPNYPAVSTPEGTVISVGLADRGVFNDSDPSPFIKNQILHVSGVRCEKIGAITSDALTRSNLFRILAGYIARRDYYMPQITLLQAFYRILLLERNMKDGPQAVFQALGFLRFILFPDSGDSRGLRLKLVILGLEYGASFLDSFGTNFFPGRRLEGDGIEDAWTQLIECSQAVENGLGVVSSALKILGHGYRFFETQPAGFLGLGPKDMVGGDWVCILKGCPTPVLMREESRGFGRNGWRFVGSCFVLGISGGEAGMGGRSKVERFKIR
jgi:Heterokaryon incompatibility protein (HET)